MKSLALVLVLAPALAHAGSTGVQQRSFTEVARAQRQARRVAFRQLVDGARAAGVPTRVRLMAASASQGLTRVAAVTAGIGTAVLAYKFITATGAPHDEWTAMGAGFIGGTGTIAGMGLWGWGDSMAAGLRGRILVDAERAGVTVTPAQRADFIRSGLVELRTP